MEGIGHPVLLDCGHVDVFTGVCQFEGCGTRLCPACVTTCEVCGRVLCRSHQVRVAAGARVFCPADLGAYLLEQVAVGLLARRRGDQG